MGETASQSAGRLFAKLFAKHFLVGFAVVACGLPFSSATAADVLNVVLGGSAAHDTNLFKGPVATSETIRTGYAGLRLDKPYSLQRFQFDVTATSYRYGGLSYLDFDALDYHAAWLWSVTPRLSGSLRSERTESQVPFFDFNSVQRNVRVNTRNSFDLDGAIAPALHATFGVSESKQVSSQPFLAQPDFKLHGAEVGLRYSRVAGNSIALVQRRARGEYIRNQDLIASAVPLDTRYSQNETELHLARVFSHSALSAKVSWIERHHDELAVLDSSGWGGDAIYTWNTTDKLAF